MLAGLCLDTTSVNTVQTGAITVVKQAFEKKIALHCGFKLTKNEMQGFEIEQNRNRNLRLSLLCLKGNSSSNPTNPQHDHLEFLRLAVIALIGLKS